MILPRHAAALIDVGRYAAADVAMLIRFRHALPLLLYFR